MVKKNRTKAKLKAGGVAYGITVGPGELTLVELGGALGFDYVMVDWEHYLFSARDIEDVIRAADIYGMPKNREVKRKGNTFQIDGTYESYYYQVRR